MEKSEPIQAEFERPFPALSAAQRLHLEVNGYVVIPEVLSRDECGVLREALQKLKRDLLATGAPLTTRVRGVQLKSRTPENLVFTPLLRAEPVFPAYATHPRIVEMAEELIGGEARLVEYSAQLNTRNPDFDASLQPKYPFHTGMDVPFGSHIKNGLYHCLFVKALTNLTDLGPDDGGTVVVAGSHKLDLSVTEMSDCAYADPSLIHQVIAPAGSTLLFSETLIHATNPIRSDTERAILIAGYGASMLPMWNPPPGEMWKAAIPERYQTLLLGKASWTRAPRYRNLNDAVDNRNFTLADGWHATDFEEDFPGD